MTPPSRVAPATPGLCVGPAGQRYRLQESLTGDLTGGVRRCGSAHPKGSVRAGRADVPRPHPAFRRRYPDDRAGVRQLDSRRRLHPGHVRPRRDDQGTFQGLPGRSPLVKMATGEESDDESLGGAEMHSRVSGLGDYLAVDEQDAVRLGRQIVSRLNWVKKGPKPAAVIEPIADQEELIGIVPGDLRIPFDPVKSSRASSTAPSSTNSRNSTVPRWSPDGHACTATRSASSPTRVACCSAKRRKRPRSSFS